MIEVQTAMRNLNVFMCYIVATKTFPVAAFLLKEDADKFLSMFPAEMGYEVLEIKRV